MRNERETSAFVTLKISLPFSQFSRKRMKMKIKVQEMLMPACFDNAPILKIRLGKTIDNYAKEGGPGEV